MKIAIVVSRYNQSICERLLEGSLKTLEKNRLPRKTIQVLWVPGAFEIPLAAQKLAQKKSVDGVICLGCILKGETSHNEVIAHAVAKGIQEAALKTGVPITFGILTPDTRAQALSRSENNSANKGVEAAESLLEMIHLFKTHGL